MTRINLVPVEELHNKHLAGEYKEITRVFGLARNAQFEVLRGKRKLPHEFVLGTGHVSFFFDKLKFIADRYEALTKEMQRRGYKPNPISREDLLKGIDTRLHLDYYPTQQALLLSKERILLRMPK